MGGRRALVVMMVGESLATEEGRPGQKLPALSEDLRVLVMGLTYSVVFSVKWVF